MNQIMNNIGQNMNMKPLKCTCGHYKVSIVNIYYMAKEANTAFDFIVKLHCP